MSNPLFIPGDLAPITYTASASPQAGYPLTNLKTYDFRDYLLGPSNTTDFHLDFDFSAAFTPNAIVLHNINSGSFGQNIQIRLRYDNNDNGAYSAVTDVLVKEANDFNGADPKLFTFTGSSKRYWRLTWDKNGDTFAPKAGNIFLRKAFDFGPYELPAKIKNEKFSVNRAEALDGTLRRTNLFGGRPTWEVEFKLLSDTQKADFWLFVSKVVGPGYGFYYSDPSGALYYCYFDIDYMPVTERMYNLNDTGALRFTAFLPRNLDNVLTW